MTWRIGDLQRDDKGEECRKQYIPYLCIGRRGRNGKGKRGIIEGIDDAEH